MCIRDRKRGFIERANGEFDDMMTRDQESVYVCVWSGLESVLGVVGNVWS